MGAILHVRRPSGAVEVLLADSIEIIAGQVVAAGRWQRPSGRLTEPGRYAWPTSRVIEIRWRDEAVA